METKSKIPVGLILLSALAAAPPVLVAEGSLEEMRQACEDARESRIAPLREAAIQDCVSAPRTSRSREDCERIYAGFGSGGGTVGGTARTPMFMDLPECVEYHEAQNQQRRDNRDRRRTQSD
jgi:hypothetical protein